MSDGHSTSGDLRKEFLSIVGKITSQGEHDSSAQVQGNFCTEGLVESRG